MGSIERYNFLVVLRRFRENGRIKVETRCICGKIKTFYLHNVVSGKSKSCGCRRKHVSVQRAIKNRCRRKSNRWYSYQGERNILTDWAKHFGIPYTTLAYRLSIGLKFEQAIKLKRNVNYKTNR